jgi:hypothetical protein
VLHHIKIVDVVVVVGSGGGGFKTAKSFMYHLVVTNDIIELMIDKFCIFTAFEKKNFSQIQLVTFGKSTQQIIFNLDCFDFFTSQSLKLFLKLM